MAKSEYNKFSAVAEKTEDYPREGSFQSAKDCGLDVETALNVRLAVDRCVFVAHGIEVKKKEQAATTMNQQDPPLSTT